MVMRNPAHPGELIRLSMEAKGWTVTECSRRLGVTRNTLSRLLNGRAGVSPTVALALERIGWSDAEHWVRMQGSYDLAQAQLKKRRREVSGTSESWPAAPRSSESVRHDLHSRFN